MRAIVLAGGGAKGSYQIGVWRALRELGITYDIVCGTSVGALNGVFFVTGEYALAKYIWSTVRLEDVLKTNGSSSQKLIENSKTLWPYVGHYILHGSFDSAPLRHLVCNVVDLRKIKKSKVRFGIVTTKVPQFYPVKLEVGTLPDRDICKYLMASASLFPAFPMAEIHGEKYVDGGLFDNMPIDLAIQMGADEIIVIGLGYNEPLPSKYQNHPKLIYISPTRDLGNVLDFDHEKIISNMKLGYQDAISFLQKIHF